MRLMTILFVSLLLVACGDLAEIKLAKKNIENSLLDPGSVQYREVKIVDLKNTESIGVDIDHKCSMATSIDEIFRCESDPVYFRAKKILGDVQDLIALSLQGEGKSVCIEYNSKNSMGGYVGFRKDVCVVKDGSAVCLGFVLGSLGSEIGSSNIFKLSGVDSVCK